MHEDIRLRLSNLYARALDGYPLDRAALTRADIPGDAADAALAGAVLLTDSASAVVVAEEVGRAVEYRRHLG